MFTKLLQYLGLRPRKHRCIYYKVRLPLYKVTLQVVIADNYRQVWSDLFPHLDPPSKQALGTASFHEGYAYVGLRTKPRMGTLVHEAAHITHRIMDFVGIEHDLLNDEPECYLLTAVMDELVKATEQKPATYWRD